MLIYWQAIIFWIVFVLYFTVPKVKAILDKLIVNRVRGLVIYWYEEWKKWITKGWTKTALRYSLYVLIAHVAINWLKTWLPVKFEGNFPIITLVTEVAWRVTCLIGSSLIFAAEVLMSLALPWLGEDPTVKQYVAWILGFIGVIFVIRTIKKWKQYKGGSTYGQGDQGTFIASTESETSKSEMTSQ